LSFPFLGTGRHIPVMPDPDGASRSQTATSGRSFTALLEIVAFAEATHYGIGKRYARRCLL
jgi:hypothetical protein